MAKKSKKQNKAPKHADLSGISAALKEVYGSYFADATSYSMTGLSSWLPNALPNAGNLESYLVKGHLSTSLKGYIEYQIVPEFEIKDILKEAMSDVAA